MVGPNTTKGAHGGGHAAGRRAKEIQWLVVLPPLVADFRRDESVTRVAAVTRPKRAAAVVYGRLKGASIKLDGLLDGDEPQTDRLVGFAGLFLSHVVGLTTAVLPKPVWRRLAARSGGDVACATKCIGSRALDGMAFCLGTGGGRDGLSEIRNIVELATIPVYAPNANPISIALSHMIFGVYIFPSGCGHAFESILRVPARLTRS